MPPSNPAHGIQYRTLGRTGELVSAIGVGGHHLGLKHVDAALAERIVRGALDRGINFLDNSWDYHGGESERRMGRALRGDYRQRAFLMTKVDGRSKKEAARQLDESLRRLGVDYIDLVQHHEVIRFEDADRIFDDAEGANQALIEARHAGKLRYIGFTGHKDPHIHLHTLDVARSYGFTFDAVQMPLNVMDAHFRSFERLVLPRLTADAVGVIGMKCMGNGLILRSGMVTAEECLRYALSLPTSVVVTGIDTLELLDQAVRVATTFRPLAPSAIDQLLARTGIAAASGEFELFKTSAAFDSTTSNPHWLGEERKWVQGATPG
jgi:aryl-alcohol dehydrogenase-like predicted oxidoreductase